jgi:hypothetical protein
MSKARQQLFVFGKNVEGKRKAWVVGEGIAAELEG